MASLHVSRSACSAAEMGGAARRVLLPLVLMAHADVDEELRSHAFSCAGSISHLQLDTRQVSELMDDMGAIRQKAPWRVRLACLPFVQAVGFLHSITSPPRRPSSLLIILEKSLVDKQPENRERAMVALSQITPAMDNDTITALAARFVKLSRSTLKPRKAKNPKHSDFADTPSAQADVGRSAATAGAK